LQIKPFKSVDTIRGHYSQLVRHGRLSGYQHRLLALRCSDRITLKVQGIACDSRMAGLLVGIVDPPFADSAMSNHKSMRVRDTAFR
jgi:hypothetical protein